MPYYVLTQEDRDTLRLFRGWIKNFNGTGVVNAPTGATIHPPGSGNRGGVQVPNKKGYFLAKITGSASLATNRWKYAWTEQQLSGDLVTDKTNGRSGTTTTDYAINLAECYHTSTYAWTVDTTGTDYPAGFVPQPVGGGGASASHRYDVAVVMYQIPDVNGTKKYVFFAGAGGHDGTCT